MVTDLILLQFTAGGGNLDMNILLIYSSQIVSKPRISNVREKGENEGMSCSMQCLVWAELGDRQLRHRL